MFEYAATVKRVVDGDTMDLTIDLGFRILTQVRCRLLGVDTPETYGVKKGSEEYQKGMAAKSFVKDWLHDHGEGYIETSDGHTLARIVVRSHDGGPPRAGKYGRWLVEVMPFATVLGSISLNQALIQAGHAVAYDGGRR